MNNYKNGAVLCARCSDIIATGITPQEAEHYYPEGTLCGECLVKEQKDNELSND